MGAERQAGAEGWLPRIAFATVLTLVIFSVFQLGVQRDEITGLRKQIEELNTALKGPLAKATELEATLTRLTDRVDKLAQDIDRLLLHDGEDGRPRGRLLASTKFLAQMVSQVEYFSGGLDNLNSKLASIYDEDTEGKKSGRLWEAVQLIDRELTIKEKAKKPNALTAAIGAVNQLYDPNGKDGAINKAVKELNDQFGTESTAAVVVAVNALKSQLYTDGDTGTGAINQAVKAMNTAFSGTSDSALGKAKMQVEGKLYNSAGGTGAINAALASLETPLTTAVDAAASEIKQKLYDPAATTGATNKVLEALSSITTSLKELYDPTNKTGLIQALEEKVQAIQTLLTPN